MVSCSRDKTGTISKATEKLYKSYSLGKETSFYVIQAFFLISCCLERNVCAFRIPSQQVVNVHKHQLVCPIMRACSGHPSFHPRASLPEHRAF